MKLIGVMLGFGAIVCWSFNSLMINWGLKDSSVFKFNAIRTIPALVLLVTFMLMTGKTIFPEPRLSILAFATGFFSYFVALNLFISGLNKGGTHKVWPVGNTAPFWATVSAILILDEKANTLVLLSAVLIVIGIFFLSRRGEKEADVERNMGVPLAFLAAFIWGILVVPNKYCLNQGMSPLSFLTIMIIAAFVSNNIYFLYREGFEEMIRDIKGLYWGLVSGIIALFGGGLFWQLALSVEDASRLAPLLGAESPIVLILSVLLLGESPTYKSIFGIALVFFGVLIVTTFG